MPAPIHLGPPSQVDALAAVGAMPGRPDPSIARTHSKAVLARQG